MFLDFKVNIPQEKGKITKKVIRQKTYVYYIKNRVYNPEKKHTQVNAIVIGKVCEDEKDKMFPNETYFTIYLDSEIPDEKADQSRSSCLKVGSYIVIQKIIQEYGLDKMAMKYIGDDWGLFLDLVAYTIISEDNVSQYYPDYAYNHPLFTEDMRIYSDTKVSSFLKELTRTQQQGYLDEWNADKNHTQKIYVSYDSTNKACDAGEVEIVENGHYKEGEERPIFNYSIAYDLSNRTPLFYEQYPGSIVDNSQLEYVLEKVQAYGYKNIGFILDRGYFSKKNIHLMQNKKIPFVMMVKGQKSLVNKLVKENIGGFEKDRLYSIRKYKVNGITVKHKLFPEDKEDSYFHIYYSEYKAISQREEIESKIDQMGEWLKEHEGKHIKLSEIFKHYFYIETCHEGKEDETFICTGERTDVINEEISLCGYFVIITAEEMKAPEAITLYKSRDNSEKLFRGDKSYLGNKRERTHLNETTSAKIFVEFIALIVRNKIYTSLLDEQERNKKKANYMNVAAALKELDKMELIRMADRKYHIDHAITSTQKAILKAFGIDTVKAKEQMEVIAKEIPTIP